jgi:hypothetical protein
MHCCLIYLAKKPLIQQKQKEKTRRQDKDKVQRHVLSFVFKISCVRRYKDKSKTMSLKPPGLPASPRSKQDREDKTKTKIS